jgi:glyoxylase-like metal-dependent hydrolase (beta-lactamase superfamily II)
VRGVSGAAARRGVAYLDAPVPEPGEAAEIAEGVLWARLPLPMRLDHVNVYALDEGDGWTIVDTGFDNPRSREIWRALLAGPLGGRPVRRVVVTHHHPDHVGLAGWFQAQGAELLATRTAWLFARMLRLDEQPSPPPETVAFWRAAGMAPDLLEERAATRPFNYADKVAALPLGFTRLHEGQSALLGGRRWTVRLGQGHAPDHATFWGDGHDLVLTGDQILPRITPNLGVYPTEPEADPVGEWLASCRRLAAVAAEGHIALPGHQRPFTGLPARLAALAEGHHEMLERLLDWLAEPRVAADCFPALYGRPIEGEVYGLALAETIAHLNHLRAQGLATRDAEGGVWKWRRADAAGGNGADPRPVSP